MISILLLIISVVIFIRLNKFHQFIFLSLSALLPLSIGKIRTIPDVLLIEYLTITAFMIVINDLIPLRAVEKKMSSIKFKGIEVFIFALFILVVWAFISLINNEILINSSNTGGTGTKRLYFNIFNNILLFFTVIFYAVTYYDEIDFKIFFKTLLSISIVIGFFRIISYFMGFDIPFLAGAFDYGGAYGSAAEMKYGGIAYRFGGLSEVVIMGIPALFGLYVIKKRLNIPALIILLLFVFMSGGRTIMIGVFLSIIIFSIVFLPKNFIYLVFAGGLFFILAAIFLPEKVLQGQFGRLSTFDAGHFMGQDASRGIAWKLYLENFINNPVLGRGIIEYKGFIYSSNPGSEEFARAQQFAGGHGSYFSLLSTFGIGGLLYFIIMVFGGIFLSFRKTKQYLNFDTNKTAIATFCFMLLLIKAVDFITAWNGLSVPILFYAVGLAASLTVFQNMKRLI